MVWQSTEIRVIVPNIGDGNPQTARAVFDALKLALKEYPALKIKEIVLGGLLAILPAAKHRKITRSVEKSLEYTEHSPEVRAGLPARVVARGLAGQAWMQKPEVGKSNQRLAVFVQELPLLGTPAKLLKRIYGENGIFLVLPDVQGKLDQQLFDKYPHHWPLVTLLVWNTQAKERLSQIGYRVELISPPVLHSETIVGGKNELNPNSIMVKSSGNGWPPEIEQALVEELTQYCLMNPEKVYGQIFASTGAQPHRMRQIRGFNDEAMRAQLEVTTTQLPTNSFYQEFAASKPRVLIGYPSELIAAVAQMWSFNHCLDYYALIPTRGEHELENLKFGLKYGLIAGVVYYRNGRMLVRSISADDRMLGAPDAMNLLALAGNQQLADDNNDPSLTEELSASRSKLSKEQRAQLKKRLEAIMGTAAVADLVLNVIQSRWKDNHDSRPKS